MKHLLASLLLGTLSSLAPAQTPDEVARERGRIADERGRVESGYLLEEKACYRRFAVNDCLQDARRRRRAALSDLRRQEIALEDRERSRKAAERLQLLEERALERARSEPSTARGTRSQQDRNAAPPDLDGPSPPEAAPSPPGAPISAAPVTPSAR